MKHRLLDWLLILALLVGGILAGKTGWERSRLEAKHARLARMTGALPVTDPSKMYFQGIDTGEPLHFAWRVYLPPNYNQVISCRTSTGSSSSTSSSSSGPTELIARVRFREDEQGLLQVYDHFGGGSSRMGIGDKALTELLRGRWDRVRVEQLGAPQLAVLGPDQTAVLLRLTLSADLEAEARKRPDGSLQQMLPVLFELVLGPKASKP
jgi:hypothetical protein